MEIAIILAVNVLVIAVIIGASIYDRRTKRDYIAGLNSYVAEMDRVTQERRDDTAEWKALATAHGIDWPELVKES